MAFAQRPMWLLLELLLLLLALAVQLAAALEEPLVEAPWWQNVNFPPMKRHTAVFPRMKGQTDYPYSEVVSAVSLTCYTKLVNDSSCCVDQHFEPGVRRVEFRRPGTSWKCDKKTCYDDVTGERGKDVVWIPENANCRSPRVLFIHGGSWMYGSPDSLGYGVLASKLAKKAGAVVMLPDYPLIPAGKFDSILKEVGGALSWLADYGPWKPSECTEDHPPIFIGGDSSGGGTALALLLELKRSPHLFRILPDDRTGRLVAGAFFFSPWTNLVCNTPDYYHHAFAKIVDKQTLTSNKSRFYIGDIIFHGHPDQNAGGFQMNSEDYVGDPTLMMDPLASPFYAGAEELEGGGLPPLYFAVGASESIMGDTTIFAQKAAAYGAEVNVDIFEGMWHVFPMYSEGCGSGLPLWPALHALNQTARHIRHVTRTGHPARQTAPHEPSTHFVYDRSLLFRHNWFAPEQTGLKYERDGPLPASDGASALFSADAPPAAHSSAAWPAGLAAPAAPAKPMSPPSTLSFSTALLCAVSALAGALGAPAARRLLALGGGWPVLRGCRGAVGLPTDTDSLLPGSPLLGVDSVA